MWLRIEGGGLINLDLIDKVEIARNRGGMVAHLWSGGVMIVPDSKVAARYFTSPEFQAKAIVLPEPEPDDAAPKANS